jgi:hypothetical protein
MTEEQRVSVRVGVTSARSVSSARSSVLSVESPVMVRRVKGCGDPVATRQAESCKG